MYAQSTGSNSRVSLGYLFRTSSLTLVEEARELSLWISRDSTLFTTHYLAYFRSLIANPFLLHRHWEPETQRMEWILTTGHTSEEQIWD